MNKKELNNQINHRIITLAGLLKKQIHRIIAEHDISITPDQWVLLSYLLDDNGLSIGELVAKSKKDFANVTRIVEKLRKQGYIEKKKNKTDNRSYLIFYTEKALSIKADIEEYQQQSLNISLQNISKEEEEWLLEVLTKIEDNSLQYLENKII